MRVVVEVQCRSLMFVNRSRNESIRYNTSSQVQVARLDDGEDDEDDENDADDEGVDENEVMDLSCSLRNRRSFERFEREPKRGLRRFERFERESKRSISRLV